jgi:hypothetical protein
MAFGIDDAIGAGLSIINKFIPDKDAQAKAEAEYRLAVLTASQKADSDQADVNKAEAASSSIFVAGWRPFIGWTCGSGLAFQFIVAPFATWGATLAGHPVAMPTLDLGTLLTLLLGMLGLGGMRTAEKFKGVAK